MTYKDMLKRDHPEKISNRWMGGCKSCPHVYGYCEKNCIAGKLGHIANSKDCRECWNREVKARGIVYIAGPMTGVDRYWEAFEKAEAELKAKGWTVLSPAKNPPGLTNAQYMRIDFAMIDCADVVFFLPGWTNSAGARLELHYCEYTQKPHTQFIESLEEVLKHERD